MFRVGGIRDLLAVSIQQLTKDPNMIRIGRKLAGNIMKSTPNP